MLPFQKGYPKGSTPLSQNNYAFICEEVYQTRWD